MNLGNVAEALVANVAALAAASLLKSRNFCEVMNHPSCFKKLLLRAIPASVDRKIGGRERFGVEVSVTFRSNLCVDENESVAICGTSGRDCERPINFKFL